MPPSSTDRRQQREREREEEEQEEEEEREERMEGKSEEEDMRRVEEEDEFNTEVATKYTCRSIALSRVDQSPDWSLLLFCSPIEWSSVMFAASIFDCVSPLLKSVDTSEEIIRGILEFEVDVADDAEVAVAGAAVDGPAAVAVLPNDAFSHSCR